MMFEIENSVRELIISMMESKYGAKWYKDKLPGDVLKKYKKGLQYEQSLAINDLTSYHPIYYIDFPQLREIIIRVDNWKNVFKQLFKDKERINTSLSVLEPIRNKLSHNRLITTNDFQTLKSIYSDIINWIGEDKFLLLISKCTSIISISDHIRSLLDEIHLVNELCNDIKEVNDTPVWDTLSNSWWFDESYLKINTELVANYYSLIQSYKKFNRKRGTAHLIEKWLKDSNLENISQNVITEINNFLKTER